MAIKITLSGDQELIRRLSELEKKVGNQIARKALREGAKIVQKQVKNMLAVRSGLSKKSVKVRAAKRKKGRIRMNVSIGAKDYVGKTYYAAFVEYGHKTGKRGSPNRKQVPGQHKIQAAAKAVADQAKNKIREVLAEGIRNFTNT